ncbi:uncharacterized protein LOC126822126 [Patella vulgata]|uniref:uncharacterized protein LOC126822126 n=1 Tax=Patella vulgata TaxID=6465 RepID=UPI0021803763|nr:uncharacterized protein LOC126822126 [Patella vulgata]
MLIFAILIVLPALFAGAYIPGNPCGGVVCLDRPEVTCLPQYNYCRCNDGYVGSGRFGCVDKEKSCICHLFGDPYVKAFSGSVMSQPLPCRHILAEFTTPFGLQVSVSASAIPGGNDEGRGYPGYVFENALHILVKKGNTTAHAEIRRDGFFKKGLYVPLPASKNFPDFGLSCYGDDSHYWTFAIPGKGVNIRYRSADSSLTIEAPKDSDFTGNRICGDCGDTSPTYLNAAKANNLTPDEWSFLKTVQNLDTEQETNEQCAAIGNNYNQCRDDLQDEAAVVCGLPYSHKDIGKRFVQAYGADTASATPAITGLVAQCIKDFCAGNRDTICKVVADLIEEDDTTDFSRFGCSPTEAAQPPPPPPPPPPPQV